LNTAHAHIRRAELWRDGLLGCVICALTFALQMAGGYCATDEAWFVQVLRRVSGGEILYRDVACGIAPLSVYLSVLPALLFGAEVWVLKLEQALVFAAVGVLALRLLRRLQMPRGLAELAWLSACFAWAPPGSTLSLYTPLSLLFLIAAWSAAQSWLEHDTPAARAASAVSAGVWAGAAFVTKQNVGALAFSALALALLTVGSQRERPFTSRLTHLLQATVAAGVVVALTLVPVLTSGGLASFIDYGFLGKRTYLQVAGVDASWTLRVWWRLALAAATSLSALRAFLVYQAAILPLVAFGAFGALLVSARRKLRAPTALTLLFAGAGYASVYPRADWEHLVAAVPVLLILTAHAITLAWAHGARRTARTALALCLLFAIPGALSRLASTAEAAASPATKRAHLTGVRGVLAPILELDQVERESACLATLLADAPHTFILSARAGLLSLTSGLSNPTPFDYPLVTTFGGNGQTGLIAKLDSARVAYVCIETGQRDRYGALWPTQVEDHVAQHWHYVRSRCSFALYSRVPISADSARDDTAYLQRTSKLSTSSTAPGRVFRFWSWSKRDHLYSNDPESEHAERNEYVYEGVPFRLFPLGARGTRPLYRWFSAAASDHFYTTAPDGELAPRVGYVAEGVLGAIAITRQPGTTALYRWWSPSLTDHFYTTDPEGELARPFGYSFEGITGYVLSE
jgi:hypothetical protein